MKDPKSTIRYLGFKTLSDGGRRFDFSFSAGDASLKLVSVEAAYALLSGPDHITIQECAGICYQTVKSRLEGADTVPLSVSLTSEDIARHRKPVKMPGRRTANP
jgi:hypothetical protein